MSAACCMQGPRPQQGVYILCAVSHAGLNTGSVIIRNSDWSRMLVEDMATYGKYPVDWAKEATLRAAVPTYDMGMYEQNVLIYRLTSDPSMMQRVRLPSSHAIHCVCCCPLLRHVRT